jgi:hypothetical protein
MSNARENPAPRPELPQTSSDAGIDETFAQAAAMPMSGGRRVSDRTNIHDEGSGANDTDDGLSEEEEAVRHAAEDIPTGQSPTGKTEDIPVFDRASLPPRI